MQLQRAETAPTALRRGSILHARMNFLLQFPSRRLQPPQVREADRSTGECPCGISPPPGALDFNFSTPLAFTALDCSSRQGLLTRDEPNLRPRL